MDGTPISGPRCLRDAPGGRWMLALESSTALGGVALLRDDRVVGHVLLEKGLRHGRDLLPATAGLLAAHALAPERLWGIAISAGPGSYTGCRVGVMAAKALAYGAKIRLAAVSSLAAAADTARESLCLEPGTMVMALQDARRDEVYYGLYECVRGMVTPLDPDQAVAPEEAAARFADLRDQGRTVVPAGRGFAAYAGLFAPGGVVAAPCEYPSPEAVGRLGWNRLASGMADDPLQIQPAYLRRDADAGWAKDALMT